jgi:hypothetical protein
MPGLSDAAAMSDNWERDEEVRQRGKMNEGAANPELRPRQPVEHGEGGMVTGCSTTR